MVKATAAVIVGIGVYRLFQGLSDLRYAKWCNKLAIDGDAWSTFVMRLSRLWGDGDGRY